MEHKNEILALKAKVMLQRIDKIRNIYIMILQKSDCEEINSLEIIKDQYLRMYDKLIEKGEYKKYKKIEDTIIKEIAKIELKLDEYIYDSIPNCREIILNNIQRIRKSKNYESFSNMSDELNRIEILRELLKLYSPYISKDEEQKIQYEIEQLKFDILFRKQVEELICQNGSISSNLTQYNSETEKEIFKKLLEEKINSIRPVSMNSYENETKIDTPATSYNSKLIDEQIKDDEVFEASTEQILSDSTMLERLIIIDMKKNPYNYIGLLKSKVFNAHLCNIGNNPFEKEVYLSERKLSILGYCGGNQYNIFNDNESFFNGRIKCEGFSVRRIRGEGLKADKVNYSLLEALLKSVITDENISIIECVNLYKRFGFECSPILVNIGQQCIKMIFDDVKGSKEAIGFLRDLKKDKKSQEGKYCKIDFKGLTYEFNREEKDSEDLFNQVLKKRTKKIYPPQIPKRGFRRFFPKKKEMPEQKDTSQAQKEEVNGESIINTDINAMISLIQDNYNTEMQELENSLQRGNEEEVLDKNSIERYEERIDEIKNKIEMLEGLKNRNGKLTLAEIRRLLILSNNIYKKLNIRYDERKILPLENTREGYGIQVHFAPLPEKRRFYSVETSRSFLYGPEYMHYYKSDLKPLWEKYKSEFEKLGIGVKKYSRNYESKPHFEICVNLDDISDLPIDYEKVTLLTKEELQKIIEREEGNERE